MRVLDIIYIWLALGTVGTLYNRFLVEKQSMEIKFWLATIVLGPISFGIALIYFMDTTVLSSIKKILDWKI